MRGIKYVVVSLVLLTAVANANPVTLGKATTVAGNFYGQMYHTDASILKLVYTENSSDGQPVYYIFDVNTNGGFVIVSAEDAGSPIIGSSNTGSYVIPTAGTNFGFWMNRRKNEVIAMRAHNIQANPDITAEWSGYLNNTARNTHQAQSAVAPLLGSIEWDQSPYYNDMCPNKSVTGCVATAMAQIMKYWAYPSTGLSYSCYYDETAYGYSENYGQLCAYYDTSSYVWSAMPDKLTSANSQVAKLMYDCGVSVDMDYSPSSSGAYVVGHAPSAQNAYVQFFNYYKWSIQGEIQSHFTASAWVALIENEMNEGRPVQYQGTDSTLGGHSWVCDGYSSNNEFHMNWGWSGHDDGYFSPTNLNPGVYDFSDEDVGAIIGIMPPYKALGVAQVSTEQTTFKVYPNPSNGVFNVELENATGAPQIFIYSIIGQQIYSSKLTTAQTTINLGSQPKGVYLYRILNESGESISTGRIVIQ